MSNVTAAEPVNTKFFDFSNPHKVKKAILVAIAALMALGMILSYALGAPWLLIVGFFFLTLSPLFPLGKSVDDQRARILE